MRVRLTWRNGRVSFCLGFAAQMCLNTFDVDLPGKPRGTLGVHVC